MKDGLGEEMTKGKIWGIMGDHGSDQLRRKNRPSRIRVSFLNDSI